MDLPLYRKLIISTQLPAKAFDLHCELEYMVKKTEGVGGQGVVVKRASTQKPQEPGEKIQALEVQRPIRFTKTIPLK